VSAYDAAADSMAVALPEVTGENAALHTLRDFKRYVGYLCLLWLVKIELRTTRWLLRNRVVIFTWLVIAEIALMVFDYLGKPLAVAQMSAGASSPATVLMLTPHYLVVVPLAHRLDFATFFIIVYSRQMIGKPFGYLLWKTVRELIDEAAQDGEPEEQEMMGWFKREVARLKRKFVKAALLVEDRLDGKSKRWILYITALIAFCPPANLLGNFGVVGSPYTWCGFAGVGFWKTMAVAAVGTAFYVTAMYFLGSVLIAAVGCLT
jgi:hypothetical protein